MVHCPEWGGEVAVYPLSCEQIEEMERWHDDNPLGVGFRIKLLSLALGPDWTEEDVRQLAAKQGSAVKRLSEKAAELCNPGVDIIAGNSRTPSEENGSSSGQSSDNFQVDLSAL